ncbi:hypothetical protein MCHI_003826 [Candidatus Magnetoovum chiemensis]|nr:hypothetical protein MCHI_003826 [Candidatus Magnetoovum chiemensis]
MEDVNLDLKQLKGSNKGEYRIRTGKIRIIFTFEKNEIFVVFVEEVSFRADAYK